MYSVLGAAVSPTASLCRLSIPHRPGHCGAREVDATAGTLAGFGLHHEPRCLRSCHPAEGLSAVHARPVLQRGEHRQVFFRERPGQSTERWNVTVAGLSSPKGLPAAYLLIITHQLVASELINTAHQGPSCLSVMAVVESLAVPPSASLL